MIQKQVENIFSDRGFEIREHSIRNIIGDYISPSLPHVTAIGTSGGKTFTTAARLEFLFKYNYIKKGQKVLILAADKSILRGNFYEQFDSFFENVSASFKYARVRTKRELESAIKKDVDVIITLPQTIQKPKNLELLSKLNFEWFIQDEAHKWYFKKTVQRIISRLKPTYQSLLTGTPFKFNMKNKMSRCPQYLIDYTSVREMYEKGYLSDFTTQVLHSDVALTKIDYVSILGNLKNAKRLGNKELIESFDSVVKQIIKKLKIPFKNLATAHNVTNNMSSVFGKLEKTIIFTHGIPEADLLTKYLRQNSVRAIRTHSKTGIDSNSAFNLFKTDPEIKVLVAVNQGKEGFDFPELYNVIDMTFSQNFEVVMQIIGRILRKSKNITNKYFFKVAPKNTASYFVNWMNAMFMLFDYEWYSRFDGKNGFDIQIPNALVGRTKDNNNKQKRNNPQGSRKNNFKARNLESFLSLEFMKNNKWFKLNDTLSTVAYTTLGDIIRKHRSDEALTLKAEKYIDEKIQLVNAYLENPLESLRSKRQYQLDDFYIEEFSSKNNISKEVSSKFLEKPIKKLQSERSNMLLTNSF